MLFRVRKSNFENQSLKSGLLTNFTLNDKIQQKSINILNIGILTAVFQVNIQDWIKIALKLEVRNLKFKQVWNFVFNECVSLKIFFSWNPLVSIHPLNSFSFFVLLFHSSLSMFNFSPVTMNSLPCVSTRLQKSSRLLIHFCSMFNCFGICTEKGKKKNCHKLDVNMLEINLNYGLGLGLIICVKFNWSWLVKEK